LPPSNALTVATLQREGVTIVAVTGEVDFVTAPELRSVMDEVMAERPAAVVIDLSEVTFLASVGLQLLIEVNDAISSTGRFAVVADGSVTRRPLELMKFDEMFGLHRRLEEALADVGGR